MASVVDPYAAAGTTEQVALSQYPETYQIDALAQTGGKGYVNGHYYDFSGLSPAQVSAGVSSQMAQTLLQIQQSDDPAFITQRLADLQQADPAGYAAYGQLFNQIMQSAQNPTDPNQPLSGQLQTQISSLLAKGPTLTTGPFSQTEQVQNSVRGQQVGQGIYLGNAPALQEASDLDTAGQQQQSQNQSLASNYSNAGISPEDVQFRMVQQALSNLGAFQNGATPTAEFSSLSGAQSGATPITTYGANQAAPNTNAGLEGLNYANEQYAGNTNWANSQANPFVVGISGAVNGLNAYNNISGGSASGGSYNNGVLGDIASTGGSSSPYLIGTPDTVAPLSYDTTAGGSTFGATPSLNPFGAQ